MGTFINELQTAQRLAIAPATLRRWRFEGRGPKFHKFGRAVRYRVEDVEAFVEGASRTSTSDCGWEA